MTRALVILLVFASAGCSFLTQQASVGASAECQRSCKSVPPDTMSDCITRCQ